MRDVIIAMDLLTVQFTVIDLLCLYFEVFGRTLQKLTKLYVYKILICNVADLPFILTRYEVKRNDDDYTCFVFYCGLQ